jgi:hypothetical protein
LNDWIDFYRKPGALLAFAQGFGAPNREDRANGFDSSLGRARLSLGDVGETRPYRTGSAGLKPKNAPQAARFSLSCFQSGLATLFRLYPDLLSAAGICLHLNLFASVARDDLERRG